MLKLATTVSDSATGLVGMLTHYAVEMGGATFYVFQPRGLNPKTFQPVDTLWLATERIIGGVEVETPDMHLEVLGTKVKDDASGFSGMATSVTLHINGCLHFQVQPQGVQDTGSPIAPASFDIRRLSGPAINPMSDAEKQADQKVRPSPAGMPKGERYGR